MDILIMILLCLLCFVGEFIIAGWEFEEGNMSPAALLAISMVFSAAIGSILTFYLMKVL